MSLILLGLGMFVVGGAGLAFDVEIDCFWIAGSISMIGGALTLI